MQAYRGWIRHRQAIRGPLSRFPIFHRHQEPRRAVHGGEFVARPMRCAPGSRNRHSAIISGGTGFYLKNYISACGNRPPVAEIRAQVALSSSARPRRPETELERAPRGGCQIHEHDFYSSLGGGDTAGSGEAPKPIRPVQDVRPGKVFLILVSRGPAKCCAPDSCPRRAGCPPPCARMEGLVSRGFCPMTRMQRSATVIF